MLETVKELMEMLVSRKKIWLIPILILLITIGSLFILAQGSVIAPFIYTLF